MTTFTYGARSLVLTYIADHCASLVSGRSAESTDPQLISFVIHDLSSRRGSCSNSDHLGTDTDLLGTSLLRHRQRSIKISAFESPLS